MSRLLAADQSPALGTELVGRPYDASESAEPVQPPDLSAPTLQAPAPLTQLHRPARVLLGWMHPSEAQLWLVSRRQDATPTPQQVQQAERARAAVAARAVGIHQAGVVQEVAADLAEHIIALQTGPAATLLNEGWRVAIVDLPRICAAQPAVHIDHAEERTAAIDPTDLKSIAAVSLPLSAPSQLPVQFDQGQKAWVLSSANPNLAIFAHPPPV